MTKTIKQDYDSITNQEIKSKFVEREVKACFSYEMDAIFKVIGSSDITYEKFSELPSYDDIENLYEDVCSKCGESRPYDDGNGGENCECGGEFESQPQEIYEWWIVTEFLYRKLKAQGEPVLEWGNNYYWGRCTTGQSIMLDYVIGRICEDMEILDGQKYSWEDKPEKISNHELLNALKDIINHDGGAYDLEPRQSEAILKLIAKAEGK